MDSLDVVASFNKNKRITLERVEKFIGKDYFADVSLFGKIYPVRQPLTGLLRWDATGAPRHIDKPDNGTNTPAQSDDSHDDMPSWLVEVPTRDSFSHYKIGEPFGPTWSTHWFILDIEVPADWIGKEVHLLWDSGSEAMIWEWEHGKKVPVQALSGGIERHLRDCFVLTRKVVEKERKRELWLEVACNDLFGAGDGGMINPPNLKKMFNVRIAEIAVFEREVFDLYTDFEILVGMAKHLPEVDSRGYEAMYLGNHIINVMKTRPEVSIGDIRKRISKFFNQKNGESQHTIVALGHCHIDCAWLWTYDETIRKCGRSWITMIRLMEEFPDFRFAVSSAQQFLWVKQYYPVVYDQIKTYVKKGQFILVGGTWVEMDGNLPSGEAFIRQFFYGQKFFQEEFGIRCDIFWLPDTFGYSAQLPQIMQLAGIKYFLTQKMSWNLVNTFPHNNFLWRGIDGSEVLVHFPPGNDYGMNLTVEDCLKTVVNNKEKGRVNQSMLLYGYGDGGGGPTPAMIERGLRMKDIDGLPKVTFEQTASEFFQELETHKANLNTWSGELYLEMHNATYTSQAELKKNNRAVQNLFRDAEFLDAVLYAFFGIIPVDRRVQWQDFLLQQFHDVLPGSSITEVYEDANRILGGLIDALNDSCISALTFLAPLEGHFFNATNAEISYKSTDTMNQHIVRHLPPFSLASDEGFLASTAYTIAISQKDDVIAMENNFVKIQLNKFGVISSMILKGCDPYNEEWECIAPGGSANKLVLFDDLPLYWEAWDCMDYHLEARNTVFQFGRVDVRVDEIITEFQVSKNCNVIQRIFLDANSPMIQVECTVNWTESHKFLKMEVDVNVTSENKKAVYEIQHGFVERPAHRNTSWDWAKYEVCCQRWADLSEFGWGVAVINLMNHGFSVKDKKMALSLLRAPKKPDPVADMGTHHLKYAIIPHWGTFQEAGVINRAISLNDTWEPVVHPEHGVVNLLHDPTSNQVFQGVIQFFTLSNPAMVLDAVKVADNEKHRAVVVRLYESYGGIACGVLKTRLPVVAYQKCSILEDLIGKKNDVKDGVMRVRLKAFEIKSWMCFLDPVSPGHL